MSNSLLSHGLQHARLPCPSPTPRACSNSCPSSRWCHPTISSFVVPFSSCRQSFPAPGSFPMTQFFASDSQSIGVSASTSVLPMNIQDLFPLGWTGWISLQSKGLSRVFSNTTVQNSSSILQCSAFFIVQLSHPYMTTGKTIDWLQAFVGKVMSLLFNMQSRLVIAFLPRIKRLLISQLQSPSAVILEPPKIKSHCFHCFLHVFAMQWWDWMPWLVFWMLSFKPTFSLSCFTFLKMLFGSSSLSSIRECHLHIWGYWYFSWQSWFQLVLHPAQHFAWCTLHISQISRVTIYSIDVLLFWFETSLLFYVQF